MRNLKKILALVLAFVMSLSLMATAGAANFTDASSINEKYETAVEVLEGLGVFKGYQDGSFQPTGSITRAETAAIIYRIVTGDVKDEQVSIYRDYNIFKDVKDTDWYAGYVNYCANAEYIKGVGNDKFDPQGKVTGYAALAMILRAIGYTANGGFTGPEWKVETARTGEARKITKNILTSTLGQDATRETVAEILFQAIMVNMVDHNVLHSQNGQQGYTEIDMTLGYKTFGLETIEGVVVANEYANLNSTRVIGDGKTDLQVAGEETARRLDIGTKITDIGESRYAYVAKSKVLAMGDTGKNKVTEFGHACDITGGKFASVAEMGPATGIEYYVNFDRSGHYDCDQRLEFVVKFELKKNGSTSVTYKPGSNTATYATLEEIVSDFENRYVGGADLRTGVGMTVVAGSEAAASTSVTYSKIIRAKDEITPADLSVIRGIFYAADNNLSTTTLYQGVEGDVYVGTRSNKADDTDWSDELSYTAWFDKFINDVTYDISWATSLNGDWVKFVDNNGDGKAEYAFKTVYNLEDTLYTYTDRDGNVVYEYNTFDDETEDVVYLDGYTPAVGNKVLAAYIDGQWLVEPAKNETVVVSSYSWRNDEITTDKGTYGQSGITNNTDMLEEIDAMEDKVEYVVYFDHFGYVRAYELPGGTKYALLTELYYTNGNQGNLVKEWPMTAELTTLSDDGETITKEYSVTSGAGTFTAKQPWMLVSNRVATYNYNNWVQPAIAHLGVTYKTNAVDYTAHKGTPNFATPTAYATFWNANNQLVYSLTDMIGCEEFDWDAQNFSGAAALDADYGYTFTQPATASFTNVAVVGINDNDVTLAGAATLGLNKDGTVAAAPYTYSRDYIQLSVDNIAAKAVRYDIHDHGTYKADNNNWVNAVHDTQYFIAYNGGVLAFKDFENFPGLTNKENKIHAAYAVARNTASDNADKPYWVADVIVYEVYDLVDVLKQTSVSLAFYTPTRTSGNVQEINTLNSKYGPEVTLIPGGRAWNVPAGQWGRTWEGYGFYALWNDTEAVDGVMTAEDITRIGADKANGSYVQDYGKNNIHAGIIVREAYIERGGEYIDVDMGGGKIASIEVTNKIYAIVNGTALSNRPYDYNEAQLLRTGNSANNQVLKGDHVIWVGGAKTDGTKSTSNFVVDLGNVAPSSIFAANEILDATPSWLIDYTVVGGVYTIAPFSTAAAGSGEWQKIMKEQNTTPVIKVTAKAVDSNEDVVPGVTVTLNGEGNPVEIVKSTLAAGANLTIDVTAPYEIKSVSITNPGEGGAGKNATCVATNEPGHYKLFNVTDDVELNVEVAKAERTLTITGPVGFTATVNGAAYSGVVTKDKGTAYTVVITVPAGKTYAVNGAGKYVGATTITLSGDLNENVSYAITELTKTLTLVNNTPVASFSLKNGNGTPVSMTVGTPVTLNEGAAYTITFTAAADTTYAVTGGAALTVTGTTATLTGTLNADTVLNLTTEEATLTLDTTAAASVTGVQLAYNDHAAAAWTEGTKTMNKGATYTISFANDTDYTYEYKVGDGTWTAAPAATAGRITLPEGTLNANTTVAIKETAVPPMETGDSLTELTVTKDGAANPATVTIAANAGSVSDFPYGQATTTATFTVSDKATVKVWRGAKIAGRELTGTHDGDNTWTFTLAVGANGAALTYVVEVYSEDAMADDGAAGDTVTLTLSAVAASADTEIQVKTAGASILKVDYTAAVAGPPPVAASGTVTILTALQNDFTVADLLSYLEGANAATMPISIKVLVGAGGAEAAGTAQVTTTMKVEVTAQNGTTKTEYDIDFGTI